MKVLLLGLSGSGKSTIAPVLAEKYHLRLIEADDAVEVANGGVWPHENDEFIDRVFRETNQKVIDLDNIIYVTSWLEADWLKRFSDKGFKVIEMHADFENLVQRKIKRDNMSISSQERFVKTYGEYSEKFLNDGSKKYYLLSVDSTQVTSEDLVKKIVSVI